MVIGNMAFEAAEHSTLWLAGDVMTGRGIDQAMPHPCSPELHEAWVRDARTYLSLAEQANGPIARPMPPEAVWGEALAEIERQRPTLRLINLETAITARGQPWPGKRIHYRMHPRHVALLQAARVDVCALANNHALDWGAAGLLDTVHTLQQAGVQAAGAGIHSAAAETPAIVRAPSGQRWLVFACACADSGVPQAWQARSRQAGLQRLDAASPRSAARLLRTVRQHRRPGDRVIVSVHWGGNWGWHPESGQQAFAHALIDAGLVDLVHGHSCHHPRPIEVYRNKLILYGCGDLINDYEGIGQRMAGDLGVALLCFARLCTQTGDLLQLELQAWRMQRFRLVRAEPAQAQAFFRLFNQRSAAFGCWLQVRDAKSWRLAWRDMRAAA